MKFHKTFTFFTIILLCITIFSCNNKNINNISAKKGTIDIRKHNLKTDGILSLNGEWEFYYGQLLEPSDFVDKNKSTDIQYINVPQSWTKQTKHKKYPDLGYATYRLIIITNDTETQILLENKRIFTSSKVWLNGKLISEIGKTGKIKTEHKPDLKLLLSEPISLKNKNELIIQVSNFNDSRAGIVNPVRMGETETFFSGKILELISIISVISIIFIIGIYHFILFLYRKSDNSNLIFSILAFLFVILGLVGNDTLLKNILGPGFNTITRLFHMVASVYPAFIMGFFYLLFKKEVNKRLLILTIIFSGLLLIFSLFFDIYIIRKHISIKIAFILIVSIYFTFYSLPKAIIKKRQGAIWAFFGILILFIININDILFSLDYLRTGYFAIYGFTACIIFQSLNIAERFSFSFKKNQKLTSEIKNQNKEYLILNKELKKAKEKAENADKLKSAFLANMSHEIRTPMNAIMGFSNLLNDKKYDEKESKKLISYIIRGSNTLIHLIDDIIDISKIEAGQLEIQKENCHVNEIFEDLINIYAEKLHSKYNNNIKLSFIKKEEKDIILYTDSLRLKQVLINLTDNALKFTEKGFIEIAYDIKVSSNEEFVIFYVKDTGIGMTKEQQNTIFHRFTKLESEGEKIYRGAGLGLSICKNIVELLDGEIWIESELNEGSTFYFSIPYIKNIQS